MIRQVQAGDLAQVLAMAHALAAHHSGQASLELEAQRRDTLGVAP